MFLGEGGRGDDAVCDGGDGVVVVDDLGADAIAGGDGIEGLWEESFAPHIAESFFGGGVHGDAIDDGIGGGGEVTASEEEDDESFGEETDGVRGDIEPIDGVGAIDMVFAVSPCEAIEGIPILEGGIGADGGAGLGAELVGWAEVPLGEDEGFSEDSGGGLHEGDHVGEVLLGEVGFLVEEGGFFLIAFAGVVGVLVVIDDIEGFAFEGLGLGIPPIASAKEGFDAAFAEVGLDFAVGFGLEFGEELCAELFFGAVFVVWGGFAPFIEEGIVAVFGAAPGGGDGVFVDGADVDDGGVVFPSDAGVGVDVIHPLHDDVGPELKDVLIDGDAGFHGDPSFVAEAIATHGIEVECDVEAGLFHGIEHVVEAIEHGGIDFAGAAFVPGIPSAFV